MLNDLRIEALSQGCARCGKTFADGHRLVAAYFVKDVRSFENQVELGIIGASVRNLWVHVDCDDPELSRDWIMTPNIHHCIKCKTFLKKEDVVSPVFGIDNPRAVNPSDPTDVGLSLRERVYFMHVDCRNTSLNKDSSNILIGI
jgi:hypothetical protein